jgi:rhamnulose-1-phosphate aldolase
MTEPLLETNRALARVVAEAQEVSSYLWERGWAESSAGNLSIDLTDFMAANLEELGKGDEGSLEPGCPGLAGRTYLVTGSGRRFREFSADPELNSVLLRIHEHGTGYSVVWGGEGEMGFRPTSELPTHLQLHESLVSCRADARVVLHTHPTELVALTHLDDCREGEPLNRLLWSTIPEFKVFLPLGVGLVPYHPPGSVELANATRAAIDGGHRVAVWQFHGCLAVGSTPAEAFDRIDTANKAARIALLFRAAGQQRGGLGVIELDELARLYERDSD